VTTLRRVEWRGDLFASELPGLLRRLGGARVRAYDLPHTLTLFLQHAGRPLEVEHALRIRAYGRLDDFSAESVAAAIERGLAGKLQIKDACGAVTELGGGRVAVLRGALLGRADGLWRVRLGSGEYVAASVRVARRTHHELDLGRGVRVTVDHERRLFRLHGQAARFLGDLGPRVEIKAARPEDAQRTRELLDPDGRLRRLPYRSLELLFQDELRGRIAAETHLALPEIEVKFDVPPWGPEAASGRVRALVQQLAGGPFGPLAPLLPFPHQVVRLRRYHMCAPAEGERRVIVETAAGRLSPKVKRQPRLSGPALLRATSASHTTDLDGACVSPLEFAAARGWSLSNVMDKLQAKWPFVLPGGRAYQLGVDDCQDAHGRRLFQVELEYIGTQGPLAGTDEVCDEIAALATALRAGPQGARLVPSTRSKSDVFEARAASQLSGTEGPRPTPRASAARRA